MDKLRSILLLSLFVGMWLFVTYKLSRQSGWSKLADKYPASDSFDGKRWYAESIRMNEVGGNIFILGSSRKCFYMSVIYPFKFGYKPLMIPWQEIMTTDKKGWIFKYVMLTFRNCPCVEARIYKSTWDKILRCEYTPKDLQNAHMVSKV